MRTLTIDQVVGTLAKRMEVQDALNNLREIIVNEMSGGCDRKQG